MSEKADGHNMGDRRLMQMEEAIARAADPALPVIVAGPTGSGKSALALAIADTHGGTIVNADALQVYAHWRILTARPDDADLARAPHTLYGHVGRDTAYSAGHWLREVGPLLDGARPIVTGGTGLYLSALTRGLAHVPPIPPAIREEADALDRREMLAAIDPPSRARLDPMNRARVQRAWEVLAATGRGLAAWQQDRPAPLLPPARALCLIVEAPPETLNPRIARRFDAMLAAGALGEVAANLDGFDPRRPGDRAIGAAELAAHLRGEIPLAVARDRAIVATRQYAKRQRTWFRRYVSGWHRIAPMP